MKISTIIFGALALASSVQGINVHTENAESAGLIKQAQEIKQALEERRNFRARMNREHEAEHVELGWGGKKETKIWRAGSNCAWACKQGWWWQFSTKYGKPACCKYILHFRKHLYNF